MKKFGFTVYFVTLISVTAHADFRCKMSAMYDLAVSDEPLPLPVTTESINTAGDVGTELEFKAFEKDYHMRGFVRFFENKAWLSVWDTTTKNGAMNMGARENVSVVYFQNGVAESNYFTLKCGVAGTFK